MVKSMETIFLELFHVEIAREGGEPAANDDSMVCIGRLHQDDVKILLRFFFDQELLKPLLSQIYEPGYLEKREVYEDAACEIVNILCSQIKAFLNKRGYHLEFDLPETGNLNEAYQEADSIMNVNFSLNKEKYFFVDLNTGS